MAAGLMVAWLSMLSGCANWPAPVRSIHRDAGTPAGQCAALFSMLDEHTAKENAVDSGYARVEHYPYLRADRFIASFAAETGGDRAFAAWIDRMQALDRTARTAEIANLSESAVASVQPTGGRPALFRQVAQCGDLLRREDFNDTDSRERLRENIRVPDEYIVARRALGVYPVSKWFVSRGIERWHNAARETFSTEPPQGWSANRYLPADEKVPAAASHFVERVERDGLGIPMVSAAQRKVLFRIHAPVWQIQYRSDDDRIGWPRYDRSGNLSIDTDRPVTFSRLSFTRFQNTILVQLNYIIWLPARTKRSPWDIYGGPIDGLNFRVTLDVSGAPILYETIHNCGCYYKAYPTDRLHPRQSIVYAEKPLILAAPKQRTGTLRMVVAMDAGSHYVQSLYPYAAPRNGDQSYSLVDYEDLKRLPHPSGGRQSLFNRYGIVAGSERLERFILWPMGVYSPGAMRQWGRHPVAFVGRRHFDDPFYLEKIFDPVNGFLGSYRPFYFLNTIPSGYGLMALNVSKKMP
jgi:hypothetical protein